MSVANQQPATQASVLRPILATIAVVYHQQRILLVRRANSPDVGRWGFPGGKVDAGESIQQAAVRELQEETSIQGKAQQVFNALDVFDHDDTGKHHHLFVS